MEGSNFSRFGREQQEEPERFGVVIQDDQAIIDFSGEIDRDSAMPAKQVILDQFDLPEVSVVVIDMENTTFLDSTSLGILMHGVRKARQTEDKSFRVRIGEDNLNIRKIFEITMLDRVLNIELIPHEPTH